MYWNYNNLVYIWAENYTVYIEAQAGFRANMGTTDNVFVMHGLINYFNNREKNLHCAFVDFKKAFNFIKKGHNLVQTLNWILEVKC